jgi:hypothetical protein
MIPRRCIATLVVICMLQPGIHAQSNPVELKWSELSPVIMRQDVEMSLPGATIRGEVISVRDDALVVDVEKTTDSKSMPKGNALIPRASVTLLKVIRAPGRGGRTMGTTVGVISGLTIGGYTAGTTANSPGTGIPIFLAVASGIAIAGYFLGKKLDSKTTLIRVVP